MKDLFINPKSSIKEALKKLDQTAEKTLLVVDNNKKLLGTITDGDIRRYIIKYGLLEGSIENIYNRRPITIFENEINGKKIKDIFLQKKIDVLPVVDKSGKIVKYLTWYQAFGEEGKPAWKTRQRSLGLPVVIMAGGKGKRLAPFTDVFPKPLIPIGEKTMVEHIISNFKDFGVIKFFLTLNYKGELIESYFNSIEKDYKIEFIWEEKFLGTAGSLKLIEQEITTDFIVSNCDIMIKADFLEIYEFHKKNNSVFTSITSIQHYKIPYGVVRTGKGGKVINIEEKPEHTFQINTGVYILNKRALKYIPENTRFDMPDLIKNLIANNENVFAFPVSGSSYVDVGQWEEYKKNIYKLQSGGLNVW